jgi:hypothetical protein
MAARSAAAHAFSSGCLYMAAQTEAQSQNGRLAVTAQILVKLLHVNLVVSCRSVVTSPDVMTDTAMSA